MTQQDLLKFYPTLLKPGPTWHHHNQGKTEGRKGRREGDSKPLLFYESEHLLPWKGPFPTSDVMNQNFLQIL